MVDVLVGNTHEEEIIGIYREMLEYPRESMSLC
jgi:hypothetical protein